MLELIRTVTHEFDDGGEQVIQVKTLYFERDGFDPVVTIGTEDDGANSVMINSEAQAKELFRAVKAAGQRLGWFEE